MGAARVLAIRGATLFGVIVAVLLILVVTLGAAGVSSRMLNAIVNENLRPKQSETPISWRKCFKGRSRN